jgi:hypothetical protein
MRRWLAMLVVLGCGAWAGCLSDRADRSTVRSDGPPLAGLVGEDVVYLDVAVIERPLGDPFFNEELWTEADEQALRADGGEQAISLERKTELEKNGFRVGQVGGLLPPTKLQDLLLSRRSCEAHRIQLHAGHETTIAVGPLRPRCSCRLSHDGEAVDAEFEQAQCRFEVVPSLTGDGRIQLRFTPHVTHGERKAAFVSQCEAGVLHWGRQDQQPEEVYNWLSWSVTVAPNEYVVIGTKQEQGKSLGEGFFVSDEEELAVQRLLVLRTAHVPTPSAPADEKLRRSPPLALRASMTAVRGRGE